MRLPPRITQIPRYPVVVGTILLAMGASYAAKTPGGAFRLYPTAMVFHGEPWRLLTCVLPDDNPVRLLFSIYWVWILGSVLEEVYGHLKTAAILLLLAVGSSALAFALFDGATGLSGAAFGIFGLLLIAGPREKRLHGVLSPFPIVFFTGVLFLGLWLTVVKKFPVGSAEQVAGLLLGALVGWALVRPAVRVSVGLVLVALVGFGLWGSTAGHGHVNHSPTPGMPEAMAGDEEFSGERYQQAVIWFHDALALEPKNDRYWVSLGECEEKLKDDTAALTTYRKAADLGSDEGKNGAAWLYATSDDLSLRNPALALQYAREATDATKENPRPDYLDTLAEALYLNQQYAEAVKSEEKAIDLLPLDSVPDDIKIEFQHRLDKCQKALDASKRSAAAAAK